MLSDHFCFIFPHSFSFYIFIYISYQVNFFCRFQVLAVIRSLRVRFKFRGGQEEVSVSVVCYWGVGEDGLEEALRPPPSSPSPHQSSVRVKRETGKIDNLCFRNSIRLIISLCIFHRNTSVELHAPVKDRQKTCVWIEHTMTPPPPHRTPLPFLSAGQRLLGIEE